ncbi:MAG: MATE family efflux transporter [Eubacteriales bacterium]|nr:MATE family efflux transporter [Lachnospiraceae bacterium]MDO5128074.1 MATE family efflux transporter [Eubacteriales bacterium]
MNNSKALEINENTPLRLLALPMFVELFLNIMLNNVDTLMLSHYSENAVGAVGNANQMMMFIILMFNIIATATSVVVAQYLGAKDYNRMNMIYTLAFIVNIVFGIVLSLGLVIGRGFFLDLLKISPEMRPDAKTYIMIVGGFLFLQAGYNVMLQILRCNGYTKVGMYVSVIVNVINIIGNYLFLYGPLKSLNLGVAGVAISTVTARTVALIVAFVVFLKVKIGRIALRYIRPFPTEFLMKMIRIGLPTAGENMSYNLYQLVLLSFVNTMGNDSVNARIYCNSLIAFAMLFSNSQALATQIITGHLVGAGKEDEAYKRVFKTLKVSLPITFAFATVNWLLCPLTLRIFTSNKTVIHYAFYIMLVDIFLELGRCLNVTVVNSLKSAGDYFFTFFIGLLTMWGLGATIGYVLGIAAGIGVAGVFIGTATDECVRGLIVLRRWQKKKWYGKAIVEKTSSK